METISYDTDTNTYTCPRCGGTHFTLDADCGELLVYCSNPQCVWMGPQGELNRAYDRATTNTA